MSNVAPLSLLSAVVVLDSSLEGWSLLAPGSEERRSFRKFVLFDAAFASAMRVAATQSHLPSRRW